MDRLKRNAEHFPYGVIAKGVRFDRRLTSDQKLFYIDILTNTNQYGYCLAPDETFMELSNKSKQTIERWTAKLESLGYIKVQTIDGTRAIVKTF